MRFERKILAILLVAALLLATGAWAESDHGHVSLAGSTVGTGDHPNSTHPNSTHLTSDLLSGDRPTGDRPANDHPASCHGLSGKNPADSRIPDSPHSRRPAPLRYGCCLVGHDVATAQASYASQPLVLSERAIVQNDPSLGARFVDGREVSTILFADPPGITSLRI